MIGDEVKEESGSQIIQTSVYLVKNSGDNGKVLHKEDIQLDLHF